MRLLSNTVDAADALKEFYKILDMVHRQHERFTLTRNGVAEAVVMSVQEYEGWLEMIEGRSNAKKPQGQHGGSKKDRAYKRF